MLVTRVLTKEHVLIKQVLQLLDRSRQVMETGDPVPGIFFEKAVIFCEQFADQFHHFKEEFLLFGMLSYKKHGDLDTAMGVLRYQHERCKQSIARIRTALPRYAENDEMAVTLCHNQIQDTYAGKQENCLDCEFYFQVRAEQGSANIRTKFLKFVHPFAASPILNHLEQVQIDRGTRFITQGSQARTAYIIQQGACLELVENEHGLHPVGHRSEGDIVGMISLLTGEPMGFHVEAETDLEAWVIRKHDFDRIPEQDPDLYAFLTELVADRFDRNGPIAERRIGPYLITGIIGKGGYSIVYKAVHLDLETPVAVEMLRHHLSMNPEFKDNFKNEARIIADLDHPHILKVYDITSRYKTVFIACEYLTGLSLEELIVRQHRIPPDLTRTYLDQLLSALAYAGKKGLIHRDINPANIMVSEDHLFHSLDSYLDRIILIITLLVWEF